MTRVVTVKYISDDIVLSSISPVIMLVVLETVAFTAVTDNVVKNVSIVDTVVRIGNGAVV